MTNVAIDENSDIQAAEYFSDDLEGAKFRSKNKKLRAIQEEIEHALTSNYFKKIAYPIVAGYQQGVATSNGVLLTNQPGQISEPMFCCYYNGMFTFYISITEFQDLRDINQVYDYFHIYVDCLLNGEYTFNHTGEWIFKNNHRNITISDLKQYPGYINEAAKRFQKLVDWYFEVYGKYPGVKIRTETSRFRGHDIGPFEFPLRFSPVVGDFFGNGENPEVY